MGTIAAALLAAGCGGADEATTPQPMPLPKKATVPRPDAAAGTHTPLCPRAGPSMRVRAEAALRAAMEGVDCGAKTPLTCPKPTAVPTEPRVPTLEEATKTLFAAMQGVKCDADAVLAAQIFLDALATGHRHVQPDELHITDQSLPACTDDHLPDNKPTTPEEAEAQAATIDESEPAQYDASRGGTVTLCRGRHIDCVAIGEYTGPPIKTD